MIDALLAACMQNIDESAAIILYLDVCSFDVRCFVHWLSDLLAWVVLVSSGRCGVSLATVLPLNVDAVNNTCAACAVTNVKCRSKLSRRAGSMHRWYAYMVYCNECMHARLH